LRRIAHRRHGGDTADSVTAACDDSHGPGSKPGTPMTSITLSNGRTFNIAKGIGQAPPQTAPHPSPVSAAPSKPNKYGPNTVVDGDSHSKREADQQGQLRSYWKQRKISQREHPGASPRTWPLPALSAAEALRSPTIVVDFRYFDGALGHFVEDVWRAAVSRLMRHLMPSGRHRRSGGEVEGFLRGVGIPLHASVTGTRIEIEQVG
jgi:hypothetical protein